MIGKKRWAVLSKSLFVLVVLCVSTFLLYGCADKPKFSTEYQAVFIDNGRVVFGKLENTDSQYPLMKEVFYILSQSNPESKEVKNILVKQGNELHGPDMMYINRQHIVSIEPVAPASKVAQLIKDAKAQAPAAATK